MTTLVSESKTRCLENRSLLADSRFLIARSRRLLSHGWRFKSGALLILPNTNSTPIPSGPSCAYRMKGEMAPSRKSLVIWLALGLLVFGMPSLALAQLLIVGNEAKITGGGRTGAVTAAGGQDTVSILDIRTPEAPRIIANIPLPNTVIGPPTNVAITPDERLALVANSANWVKAGSTWKMVPDDHVYVIDLKANPPRHTATITVGRQPSGLSINARGDLALVANRVDRSISVLSIAGNEVKVVDTIAMRDEVIHVAFTPDGRHALAVKPAVHKVAILDVTGLRVADRHYDIAVGLWPNNVDMTPNSSLAIVNNGGTEEGADGQIDSISVIDLTAPAPRVIAHVTAADGIEGLAISPTGTLAVSVATGLGDDLTVDPQTGRLVIFSINGKRVTKVGEVPVGRFPQGVAFSPDGAYIYVGNYDDRNLTILRVVDTQVTDTGQRMALPGQPASLRGRAR
jgi:DNA-binding beta-propeller fold protein YncE